MACKYTDNFTVPPDFPLIYNDFLASLLKDQPADIVDYAAYYFEAKQSVISSLFYL